MQTEQTEQTPKANGVSHPKATPGPTLDDVIGAYQAGKDEHAAKLASDPNAALAKARQIGRSDARADFTRAIRAKLSGVRGR